MRRILFGTLTIGALLIGGYFTYAYRDDISQDVLSYDVPEAVTFDEIEEATVDSDDMPLAVETPDEDREVVPTEDADLETDPEPNAGSTPASFNLAIPFTSQAPHANWGLPYQEACEEASVLMAVSYFDSELVDLSSADAADKEILDIVDFQTRNYNMYLDTTAEETKRFAEAKYPGYRFELLYDPSIDDIKQAVANGSPVIVPAAGRQLGNPNFSGAGPLYHMLVIRGYTSSSFVTNDPGTRNGNSYVYKHDTIMSAMGDWNAGDPANGAKVVIVVTKK